MNPLYQALTGGMGAPVNQMMSGSFGPMQGILGRVQQLAGMLQSPQQMVARYFPDAPAEIANDPNQLLQWMQQTGKVNPQAVQMARQMLGR